MLSIISGGKIAGTKKNPVIKKTALDMVINSIVIAGIVAFSIWDGHLNTESLLAVLKATGSSFFIQYAWERGVKRVVK